MTRRALTRRFLMPAWLQAYSLRFMPFADAASPELPLGRLLRLSLFQAVIGMCTALLVGTLNRVMIVELQMPAAWVAAAFAIPLLFAPLRAFIGYQSDTHPSVLGLRRIPFLWLGTLMQFGGLAIMPFALLVLAGAGQSAHAPQWVGQAAGALAFLLVGAGLHTTQTVGLALANDLAAETSRPKVVGLMYVMLLLGMMVSAMLFGYLLQDFSPGKLIQVIQGCAVATLVLNVVALWKQEGRSRNIRGKPEAEPSFNEAWQTLTLDPRALRRLAVVGLGTMAFTMEDVLLEPFGGDVLHMSVSATTWLTATLSLGGLMGFAWASRVLSRGVDAYRMALWGVWVGLPAFLLVMASARWQSDTVLSVGVFLIGLGGGLFSHGTLTATMNQAPKEQTGLALGAWGAVQATAAGGAMALGGVMRDLLAQNLGALSGYNGVYLLEIVLLVAAWVAMIPLFNRRQITPEIDATSNRR